MTYTHGHHSTVLRSHQWRTAENSCAYLLPHLKPGISVLDVGCGPGTITADLARAVAPGRVVGIDAAGVLESASAAVEGLANVELTGGDVMALEFPDDTFDVVHAHQVLQHVADPVGALREMRRVVKPGGIVAVRDADYEAFTWFPASEVLQRWLDLVRSVHRANGGEPDAGRRLLSWTREAGFEEAEAGASVWCYADAEGRDWWGGMWAERILSSAVAEQAVAEARVTREELREMSRAWREWSAAADGWFLVPHGEVLARG
ncbi:methyltransferase domain-containing protein [Phytomonospora sp. NPDC050363]|uniref:methyltransferase domain-containing protein n=1 Tax=Phytomonospora sp. NPDC050363 TaxID=3155642 RepID=UPI0033F5977C